MNAVILTQEQYDEIIKRIDGISERLQNTSNKNEDEFIDNADFIQIMKISKRTAQTWRDEGKIAFSQIGSKIYYRMSSVKQLLDKNFNDSFNPKSISPKYKKY